MWTCGKCGQRFVNKNQSHSCGKFSVERFLEGKSGYAIGLFRYFLTEYRKIGPFDLHPVKTRIALVSQMRFCAVNKIGLDHIDIHLVLTEQYSSDCFRKTDNLGNRFFVHHLRIHSKSDVTSEVRKYMRLAYRVGNRQHLVSRRRGTALCRKGRGATNA